MVCQHHAAIERRGPSACCAGKIQQLQAAWHLDRTCRTRGCEFIINTSDNLCARCCRCITAMAPASVGGNALTACTVHTHCAQMRLLRSA